MHLFLYQANRHEKSNSIYTYSHNRNRYKQGTIRGDFDLELLKRGIKGRYKIIPHGTHPFQEFLKKVDLVDEFYGHIVQIEEKKNAVWFKLNYDQVGKNVTKYIGGWRDLDPTELEGVATSYAEYAEAYRIVNMHASQVRYQAGNLKNVGDNLKKKPVPGKSLDGVPELLESTSHELNLAYRRLTNEATVLRRNMDSCQQVIRDYMGERKL